MKKIVYVLVMLVSLSLTAQEVSLKINYKKGDQYLMKMTMNQTLGLMGGMKMEAEMKAKVTESTSEKITTETKITQVKVDVMQGSQTFSYDSTANEEDLDAMGKAMRTQFAPMMAAVITQVTNRYGKILEAKVEPKVPGMDNFGQQSEYPKEPVKVGSTWTSVVDDDASGKITMNYKVDKITDTTVYASITGVASAIPGSTITGSLEVDIATGNPNKVEVTINAVAEGSTISVSTSMTSTKI